MKRRSPRSRRPPKPSWPPAELLLPDVAALLRIDREQAGTDGALQQLPLVFDVQLAEVPEVPQ